MGGIIEKQLKISESIFKKMNFFIKNKIKLISLLLVLFFSLFIGNNFTFAQTILIDGKEVPETVENLDIILQRKLREMNNPGVTSEKFQQLSEEIEQISNRITELSEATQKDRDLRTLLGKTGTTEGENIQRKLEEPIKPTPGACFTWSYGFQWDVCLSEWLARIASWIMWFVSSVLWIADQVFNFAIKQSIYEMSNYMGEGGGLSGIIIAAWSALRDIVNIFALMIMLYIAIGTILQLDGVNWKKMIGSIIIAAVLINFSMAISKVVIDVSNVFAIYFYEKAVPEEYGSMAKQLTTALDIAQHMEQGKVSSQANLQTIPTLGSIAINTLGIIILIICATFVLFAGAALLIIRLISLIFAVIFSPLPYIGMVIPKWGGQIAGDYWNTLINQSLFAPAYMFCLYLTMQIITCGGKTMLTKGGATESWILMIGFYIIVISFMFASLVAAKKMGAVGAGGAEKFGKWATGATVGLATGAAMLGAGTARSVARGVSKGSEGQEGGRVMGTLRNIGDDWQKNVAKPATEKITTKAGMLYESAKEKVTSPGDTISGLVKAGTGFDIMPTKGEKEVGEKAEKAYKAKQEFEGQKSKIEELSKTEKLTDEQYIKLTDTEKSKYDEKQRETEKEIQSILEKFRGDRVIELGVKNLKANNAMVGRWMNEAQLKAIENHASTNPEDFRVIQDGVYDNERNMRGRRYVETDVVSRRWSSFKENQKKDAIQNMGSKNVADLREEILLDPSVLNTYDKDDIKKIKEIKGAKVAERIIQEKEKIETENKKNELNALKTRLKEIDNKISDNFELSDAEKNEKIQLEKKITSFNL